MQSLGEFIGQNAWIVVVVLLLIVAGLFVWWRQKAKSKPPAEPDFTDLTPQEVAESIPATSLEIEPDYEPEDSYQREATEQETGLESGLETEPDYDYDLPAEASPASSIADDETEPAAVGQEIELEDAVVVSGVVVGDI